MERLIAELHAGDTPRLDLYNKADLVTEEILPHGEDVVTLSAKTGQGVDTLLDKLRARLDKGTVRVTLSIPYDKGGLVDMLYREAKVEKVEYGDTIEVVALCPPKPLGQVKEFVVDGWKEQKEFWED